MRGVLMRRGLLVLALSTFAVPAIADDAPPDKSDFTLFNPTPDADMRSFNTDRPPKANSPYTVDAGHFQYETDIAVFGYGNSDGVVTHDWTVVDPTLKLGLTNTIDAELQITPYESVATTSAGVTSNVSGIGDTVARLKITVIVMPEGDYLKDDAGGGYHVAFDFLINVSHALDQRWTLYGEIFTTQSFQTQYQSIYTLDAALTYALTPNMQLDFGGNFSLNGVAPRSQLYAGLSQRF